MTPTISSRFEAAQQQTMTELAVWFNQRCREEMESEEWKYLTPPKVRDIVATGRLRDSAVITMLPGGSFEITWAVDYATEVHEGGYTPEGQRFLGRPWTRDPLNELPAMYAELLAKNLNAKLQ